MAKKRNIWAKIKHDRGNRPTPERGSGDVRLSVSRDQNALIVYYHHHRISIHPKRPRSCNECCTMPAQSSFGQSTAVSASALIPGAILPLSSQLTGTIQGVYGNLYKNPNEKKEAPRIAFYIKCHLRTAATEYTSVDDNTKSTTRYDITFFLYPSEALLKQYTGDALSELIESMETERRALPIGRGVILDCSGMKVLEIKSEKKGKGVKLEGRGERVLEVVGKGIRRLLQGLSPVRVPVFSSSNM